MTAFYLIIGLIAVLAVVTLVLLKAINITAMAIGVLAAMLLPMASTAIIFNVAKHNQQTFNEYWNGYETAAYTEVVKCERDGHCYHEYSCDPYTVYETEFYTDSEGDTKTRQVAKTKYHDCPYSTHETTYLVSSTLRTFTIASSLMTGEPWRLGEAIPGGQVTEEPELWVQAKNRIESGSPGGVTTVNTYKNLILGSEHTIFKKYSDIVGQLKEDELLPDISKGVFNHYRANKAHFVGSLEGVDRDQLNNELFYLNGAVGEELRGDLHMVFVDADELTVSRENYTNALHAYWQNPEIFGDDALAKNTVVVIVAVEGYEKPAEAPVGELPTSEKDTANVEATVDEMVIAEEPVVTEESEIKNGTPVVAWAEAFTGMPIGNERLIQEFSSALPGEIVGENFIGMPTFDVASETVKHSDGNIESILWGPHMFERVSMESKDADDVGSGFAYLNDAWQPDSGTVTLAYIIGFIIALLALGIAVTYSVNNGRHYDALRDKLKVLTQRR